MDSYNKVRDCAAVRPQAPLSFPNPNSRSLPHRHSPLLDFSLTVRERYNGCGSTYQHVPARLYLCPRRESSSTQADVRWCIPIRERVELTPYCESSASVHNMHSLYTTTSNKPATNMNADQLFGLAIWPGYTGQFGGAESTESTRDIVHCQPVPGCQLRPSLLPHIATPASRRFHVALVHATTKPSRL